MKKYIMTYKLGSKLTGIAGIELEDDSCLNDAFKSFLAAGFPNPWHHKEYDISFESRLLNQKNYKGKAPIYKEI